MAKADIAALLALGAALFIAIGDVIHQRSAHEVTDEPVGHLRAVHAAAARPVSGGSAAWSPPSGFALQAAALGLGSVLLVQALLVSALLFALPISARLAHRRVTRWEWLWAVLLACSVAVIVTVGNPQAGQSRASFETWSRRGRGHRARAGAVRARRADVVGVGQRGAAGLGLGHRCGACSRC